MPPWVTADDGISAIYVHYNQIVDRGVVRWAAVVQANNSLYVPGKETSACQIIYSPSGVASLESLSATASRIFALKGTEPEQPDELRLANMITDEYERALDWKIPKTLTDGFDVVTTIGMIPRAHVPLGILARGYFPILADPETSLAVLVPCSYWEKTFREGWEDDAKQRIAQQQVEYERVEPERLARLKQLKEKCRVEPPLVLTAKAAVALERILTEQGLLLASTWLRVGVTIHSLDHGEYHFNFEQERPSESEYVHFETRGAKVAVDFESLPHLDGVTIDWEDREGQSGFKFLQPAEE